MSEVWKSIDGYEGDYQVSNFGRVMSLSKNIIKKNNVPYFRKSKILSPAKDGKGYLRVALSINGKLSTFKVHRLVAMAFICNPSEKPQVNHMDLDKTNNYATNLEWVTGQENTAHAIQNNVFHCSAGLNEIKLSESIIKMIGTIPDYKLGEIAKVSKKTISRNRKKLNIPSYADTTGNDGKFKVGHL